MNRFIFGAGGHGKVVLDALLRLNLTCDGFIDDRVNDSWVNLSVFKYTDLDLNNIKNPAIHIAIGNCAVREKISNKIDHFDFFNVFHPNASVSSSAIIGIGSFLSSGSIIGPYADVGKHCIINHNAVIDHDCKIGDFCHIAPQASIGGGVEIGHGVLIGAGAVVLPGISIQDYALVGAGAVVTKNVKSGVRVIGNPARIIKKAI